MKTIKMILSFLALSIITSNAMALGSEELLVRSLNKKAVAAYMLPASAHLVNITYVGASTQAILSITADALTTAAPIGTADLSIDMSAAAYDTLGELCDAINAEDDYNCALTGGKRDDDSSLLSDVAGSATVGVLHDSDGYSVIVASAGAGAETVTYVNRIGITPETGKRVVLKYCTVQSDGIGAMNVYGKLGKYTSDVSMVRNDTTLVSSFVLADDTEETNGYLYGGDWMEFGKDEHVVIDVSLAGTAQTATSHILCFWDEK